MVYKSIEKPYSEVKGIPSKKKIKIRKRVDKGYYFFELILANGFVEKEDLRFKLGYPSCFDRVIKKMKYNGLINIIKDGDYEIVKLNRSGYDWLLKFKDRKPEKFEKLFGKESRKYNISINKEERDRLIQFIHNNL